MTVHWKPVTTLTPGCGCRLELRAGRFVRVQSCDTPGHEPPAGVPEPTPSSRGTRRLVPRATKRAPPEATPMSPMAAPRPCRVSRCPSLVTAATPCPTHPPPAAWATSTRPGSTRQWRLRRARVLRDAPLCPACLAEDRVTAAVEVDHVVPLARGGTDDYANLAPICVEHHKTKTRARRRRAPMTRCLIPTCELHAVTRGYCNRHYQRWYKSRDPEALGTFVSRPICEVVDCGALCGRGAGGRPQDKGLYGEAAQSPA